MLNIIYTTTVSKLTPVMDISCELTVMWQKKD